ncbi:hypothetical protein KL86DYS2_10059 [uncultured Dysgonomonas sp.]|uniref:Uncharacterized protein n=1 Tax=uncultured Dysgonomonas sp. TaxID=206096 RepID=A0A212IU62_9BACT|nr:hypothetical protein KL86DYS2_10059 [uncultured Dysgonomonas sp.]
MIVVEQVFDLFFEMGFVIVLNESESSLKEEVFQVWIYDIIKKRNC